MHKFHPNNWLSIDYFFSQKYAHALKVHKNNSFTTRLYDLSGLSLVPLYRFVLVREKHCLTTIFCKGNSWLPGCESPNYNAYLQKDQWQSHQLYWHFWSVMLKTFLNVFNIINFHFHNFHVKKVNMIN